MVNRERMVNEFIELAQIDSLSKRERQMADTLMKKLQDMGCTVFEDEAGKKIGGNCGNIICTVKGSKNVAPILLMAHMDTVVPGEGKKPIVDGDRIRSDGTTVLGGDDLAGVECILETIRVLQENHIAHGDIQIAFTVAEEIGLLGSKNLDYDKIHARYGFVMDDGGPIGTVAVKAPSQYVMDITVRGKAAHAGLEPEKGISAILMAAEAIAGMRLGRIDEETTANIGTITGGRATNIVCDLVEIKAEARSRDERKLELQTAHMKECFEAAVKKYGGALEFKATKEYPSFDMSKEEDILGILKKAARQAGVEFRPEATGGGSDTNIINGKGICAVDVSVGMNKVHSVEEELCIDDLVKAAEFLIEIVKAVE